MTNKQLVAAAKELNEVLGLEPAIETKKVKDDVLMGKIIEASGLIDPEQDEITEETQDVIDKLLEDAMPEPEDDDADLVDDEPVVPVQPAKIPKKGKEEKPAKESAPKVTSEKVKKSSTKEKVEFLTPFIKKGTFTAVQLLDLACEEFKDSTRSAISTIISDSKNPKYNKFHALVIKKEDGTLKFE